MDNKDSRAGFVGNVSFILIIIGIKIYLRNTLHTLLQNAAWVLVGSKTVTVGMFVVFYFDNVARYDNEFDNALRSR